MNVVIGGGAPIWNDEWAERTGLPGEGFGTGMSDDDAQAIHVDNMDAFIGGLGEQRDVPRWCL